jgi:hypothetical protein
MHDYPYAYKGRRIHIQKIEEYVTYDYEIYDSKIGAPFGYCKQLSENSWEGVIIFGPHDITIFGETARELAGFAYYYLINVLLKD